MDVEKLYTLGDLSRMLGQRFHRLAYLIRTREIEPAKRAAHIGLYDVATLERLRREIQEIESRRQLPAAQD